jgi:hypothetical protein
MKTKPQLFIILLASLAGFMGGLISNHIFKTSPAFAVKAPKYQKVVIAEEFRVVDKDGKILGSLGIPGYLQNANPALDKRLAPVPQLRLGQKKGFQIILSAGEANGSRIVMKDANSTTRTAIGNTEFFLPMKKVTHKSQVASIVLFDQYGRFQWSTPKVRTELGR